MVEYKEIPHGQLKFYPDNPRIYSAVRSITENNGEPSQEDIQAELLKMEHVRALIISIKEDGGIFDELHVHGGTMQVLEGNSRLAAFRELAKKNPEFTTIVCKVLPADIDENLIRRLLSKLHVDGKRDWSPYEKAGFIYRHRNQGTSLDVLKKDLNVQLQDVKNLLQSYEIMQEYPALKHDRWSHVHELIKLRPVREKIENDPKFKHIILDLIKNDNDGEYGGQGFRKMVPAIIGKPKVYKKFISEKINLKDAYEKALAEGAEDHCLRKLEAFKKWINGDDLGDAINSHEKHEKKLLDKIIFNLKKISDKTDEMRKKAERKQDKIKFKIGN